VLTALSTPMAASAASDAFRALCVHSKKQLAQLDTIRALMGACDATLRSSAVAVEDRVALTEGLARLVASLKRPEEAQQALQQLLTTPCAVLQQCLQQLDPSSAPPAEAAAIVASQLSLVSSSIKFCDAFKPEKHPVLPVLQGIWPLLQTAAHAFRAARDVVQALCDLYCTAMTTLKGLLVPLLPQLLAQISEAFASSTVVGCLSCVTQSLQMYGRVWSEQPDSEVRPPTEEGWRARERVR
jgi:hypothetical protein